MHHSFYGYIPKEKGERLRQKGVLVAQEAGLTTAYAMESTQERGTLFVGTNTPVYEGMIIGECSRDNTLIVNPCKKKALTNMRASGSDDFELLAMLKGVHRAYERSAMEQKNSVPNVPIVKR
jgi:GTP-binding protein